jgi:dethiobiotin synthetase
MTDGRALLIAGTDTGVGKTMAGVLLITALRRRGISVAAMKPVETGCSPDPLDALSLATAAEGGHDGHDICPYRFALPVAPEAAAAAESVEIEVALIRDALERLRRESELVIVESAGGLGTPYGPELLVLDLARLLDLPVLLVARASLGTVGQTLVAARAMRHEGVRCIGVILSHTTSAPPGPDEATNSSLIASHAEGVPVLGTLPFIEEKMPPPGSPDALRAWADRLAQVLVSSVDVERLLDGLLQVPRTK